MKTLFSFITAMVLCSATVYAFFIPESTVPDEFVAGSEQRQVFVSSNTNGTIGVFELNDMMVSFSSFGISATDADGIYYDDKNDVLYQLNRTDNVINAYSHVCDSLNAGAMPLLTATSTSDFINGREIAVQDSFLVVAQDANMANGDVNKFYIYNISSTEIILEKSFEVPINLWGIQVLDNSIYAVIDNSNQIAIYNNFFDHPDGVIFSPTNIITIEGIVRTHGITYVPAGDRMFLTDVGDGGSDTDGAIVYIDDFFNSIDDDLLVDLSEQIRIQGPSTLLGNPVDLVFDKEEERIFVAERLNGGGQVLAFDLPQASGNISPVYASPFAGASAITLKDENNETINVLNRFYASSNLEGLVAGYERLDNGVLQPNFFTAGSSDADGIYYDANGDVLYQLDRVNNVIHIYGDVKATLESNGQPQIITTSTSDFTNGRDIAVSNGKLVVAQDANMDNGMQNRLIVYDVTPTSITLDRTHDVDINLWGLTIADQVLFAVVDNSNQVALYDQFFNEPEGPINPTFTFAVDDLVRTHGIHYDAFDDIMYLTDVGDPGSDSDGAIVIIQDFIFATIDNLITTQEQIRLAGSNTLLGNPVGIGYDENIETIFVAERLNNGGAILGFAFPEEGGNPMPTYNSPFVGASAIHVPDIADPISVDCEMVIGGSVELTLGGFERTIIIDGEADVISFETTVDPQGFSFTYVVTDSEGFILGIPSGNEVNFESAGIGACFVYGLSYLGELNIEVGDDLLLDNLLIAEECFDLSVNRLTINRILPTDPCEDVTGGLIELADGGLETTIIIDGEPDIINFESTVEQLDFVFAYVITDSDGIILNITTDNMVDFDPAGVGTCFVYGLSFTGILNIGIGDDLLEDDLLISDDCFDLSDNRLTINRIPPMDPCAPVTGGLVELTEGGLETTIIIDGEPDIINFESTVEQLDFVFAYVITDSDGIILNITTDNMVDFDPAGVGTCFVYGLSFTGVLNIGIGDDLFEDDLLISDDCFDLSDNRLTINRIPGVDPCEDVDGGEVELSEGGLETTIIIDGEPDVISFESTVDPQGFSFTYVVTDSDGFILGIPPSNTVDFDPAGVGTCFVYGLSFTGILNIGIGDDLFEDDLLISDDCFDLSDNRLTINRIPPMDPCADVDGGEVELSEGGLETTIIIDGEPDVISFESTVDPQGFSFTYVVTDSDGFILGIPPANMVDFDPAGVGTCFVYGLSYIGALNIEVGDDLFEEDLIIANDCWDLSDNRLTINRIEQNGEGADLSITVTPSSLLYENYENTTYRITVRNNGPETAGGIRVSAALPEGMVYTDDNTSQGDYSLFFETWDVGFLAAGASATLDLTLFTLIEDVNITFFTEVLSSNTNDPDSTPGNGAANEDDDAQVTITPRDNGGFGTGIGNADLELSISVENAVYDQYVNVDYEITVTNNGPDAAENIIIHAGVPEPLAYTDDFFTDGDYSLFLERWSIDALAAGESETLTLRLFTVDETSELVYFAEVMAVDQLDDDSTPSNGNGITPMEDDEAAVSIAIVNMPNTAVTRSDNSVDNQLYVSRLYPNPTFELLTLELDSKIATTTELMIYNINGQLVQQLQIELVENYNEVKINMSGLTEGVYLIRVPEQTFSQRFMKLSRP